MKVSNLGKTIRILFLPIFPMALITLTKYSTMATQVPLSFGASVSTLNIDTGPLQFSEPLENFAVTNTLPVANALAVNAGATVLVNFNQLLDAQSVSSTTLVLHGSQTGTYKGTIDLPTAESITFDPVMDFKAGEVIQATASSGLMSGAADPLDPPYVWQFEVTAGRANNLGTGILIPKMQESGGWVGDSLVALGDLDNDGDLDALRGAEVWFGQGNGQYVLSEQVLEQECVFVPALGDLDGDGDLDAVFTTGEGCSDHRNRIWLNDGTGLFIASQQDLGGHGFSLALGDVNLDGHLDIYISHYDAGRIWINDGQGGFSSSGQNLVGGIRLQSFLRDFDGDGDLDLLLPGIFGSTLLLNDGSGMFSPSPDNLPELEGTNAAGVGDLDDDGDLDVLIFVQHSGYLWRNNGSAKFSQQKAFDASARTLDLGDLDGDGDIDILASGSQIWFNDGQGSFRSDNQPIHHDSIGLKLGDLDNDGDLDAFWGNSAAGLRGVYLNRNKSVPPDFWVEATMPSANEVAASRSEPIQAVLNKPPVASSLTDKSVRIWGKYSANYEKKVAADGKQITLQLQEEFKPAESITVDLTTGVESADGNSLHGGIWQFTVEVPNGTGRFYQSEQTIESPVHSFSMTADLDNDGDLDILTTMCDGSTKSAILLNNGAGSFNRAQELDTGTECAGGADAGDFDLDGDLDLAIAGSTIWFNSGQGVFSRSNQALTWARDIATGDLDSDGDLDLILATGAYDGHEVWFNNGLGVFSNTGQTISAYNDHLVELGDLDNDGDLDAIFAGSVSQISLNDGYGYFSNVDSGIAIENTKSLATGDVDGDGDLDVLLASETSPPFATYLWLNDGQGVFDKAQELAGPTGNGPTVSGAIGDVDSDGDLDVVLSGRGSTWALWNDGKAKFDAAPSVIAAWDGNVVLGDFDGDSDLDIVLDSIVGHYIFLNQAYQVLLPIVGGPGTVSKE